MAKCTICGKSVQFGCNVSHSHKKTKRIWRPNLQRVRILDKGRTIRKYVCTRCLRSGKAVKAV